ncbi:hypothetical protein TrRE_jg3303 [Triparma retinervis]|uniref:Uncharacterized protein n=1 Tax=Triparma retinervis TaxID=2557542 RepID=A0A9W6Z3I5_9STRA|nr:hypothetical protein TrRE_jg3303 [Triparma retinervis]
MPVLTDEAMDAVVLEPPWEMSGDDMLGKMILQVFGARKMVECKVLGWQKPSGINLVIYRCIQKCDGEFCDLPKEEVIECSEKWQTTNEVRRAAGSRELGRLFL